MIPIFVLFGRILPEFVLIFLNWVYFISINLAMVNMLPLGPLDGGLMWRTWTERFTKAHILRKIANYGFITLIGGNIILSFAQFGLIPL
jgi:membrane-associated protease RseP (regulator of RpoE activity)